MTRHPCRVNRLEHAARVAVRAGSLLAALAMTVGVPTGLAAFVGWPLPRSVPIDWAGWMVVLSTEIPDAAVAHLLAAALWIVWAAFCYSLAVEAVAALRGRPAPRIRLISPLQAAAALLVAGIAAAPVAAGAAATPPATVTAAHAPPGAPLDDTSPAPRPAAAAAGQPRADPVALSVPLAAEPCPSRPASSPAAADLPRFAVASADGTLTLASGGRRHTVTVTRGDTLWHIAAKWLGDPRRWPQIYRLNRDRYDGAGRMRGGDHIEPGWVLRMPDDADLPSSGGPRHPNQPPDRQPPQTATPSPGASSAPPADGYDGVVPAPSGQPPSASAPDATPGTPTSPATPTPAEQPADTRPRAGQPDGVGLPGGSWADLGLAAAVAAAAAAVWLHRRRRYRPRPPSPTAPTGDPRLAPLPATVRRLRRAARQAGLSDPTDPTDPESSETQTADTKAAGAEAADTGSPEIDPIRAPMATQAPPQPVAPGSTGPLAGLWPPAGLGLTGEGAEAAARGLLASALAAGADDGPEQRGRVVVAATTLATLLGAAAVDLPNNPRLLVADDLPGALAICEEQALHRSRVLYTHEVDTVAALRDTDPLADPLPPVTLLADAAAAHERARTAALLAQGQRLDIHGVLLGDWPDGDTVAVAADGATTPAHARASRHGAHPADIGRLTVLTPDETVDLLATLAEAHTGQPHTQAAPASEPAPHARTGEAPNDEKTPSAGGNPPQQAPPSPTPGDDAADDIEHGLTAAGADTAPPAPADAAGGEAASPVDAQHRSGHPTGRKEETTRKATSNGHARVSVLGEPRIDGADTGGAVEPLRAKARELLVYLAAVGGKAGQHAILEDLLPDAPVRKAPHRLHTYVYNLRRHLSHVGGAAEYLHHPGHQYVLNPDALDVDLWQMRAGLADAQAATDPAAKTAALRHAVSVYRGPLADGCDYEWVEPHREAVRQQALNAHLALVDLIADDRPAEALAVARAAIQVDPYAEAAYRRAMTIHAKLGDLDAIRNLRRVLTRRMADLDAEPDDDTLALADRLIIEAQRRTTRKGRDAAS